MFWSIISTKSFVLISLFFLIFRGSTSEKGVDLFVVNYGGSIDDHGESVQETKDGGFVIAGHTNSFGGAGSSVVLLSKFDYDGTHLWSKTLGGNRDDEGKSVQETKDGGFVITGKTKSYGAGDFDVLLSKFDSDGTHLWSKTLGGSGYDYGNSVQETKDGGLVVTGSTHSFGAGRSDLLLSRFDCNGTHLWSKTLGGIDDDWGHSVEVTKDGGFVVAGSTWSFGAGRYDLLLSKFDRNGTHLWSKTLGGSSIDYGHSVQETKDGGLVVTGSTHSFGAGRSDLLLSRFDCNGTHLWSKTLGGIDDDAGRSVEVTSDGGFVVAGYTKSFGTGINGYDDVLLSKFDSNGTHLWSKTLDRFGIDEGHSVQETKDGGFVVTGWTESFGTQYSDVLLSKTDPRELCSWTGISPAINDISGTITVSDVDPTVNNSYPTIDNWTPTIKSIDPAVRYECVTCFGFTSDTTAGCSGNGMCVSPDRCDCFEGYFGETCEVFTCDGYLSNETQHVCHGHGLCFQYIDPKTKLQETDCQCNEGYYTPSMCGVPECFGISQGNDGVCYGHGKCVLPNKCVCDEGYVDSSDCKDWECFGVVYSDRVKTCNGHGTCIAPDRCSCDSGYGKDDCSQNLNLDYGLGFGIPVGVVSFTILGCFIFCCVISCLLFLAFCCLCICFSCLFLVGQILRLRKSVHKFTQLDDFDVLLSEQLLEKDNTIPHLRINQKLFEIKYDEVKVLEMIGTGGSDAKVYKAKWKGRIIAFKCFRTRMLLSDQDRFDHFETEVNLLGNLSHPNIVTFFGATLKPPRVGILMEFCEHGDVYDFLLKYRQKHGHMYVLSDKIRFCREICYAMEFIHSRNVIHRDLKCENVLVDSLESCKLMDFGVSRVVEEQEGSQKTKRIGTNIYISPEILTGFYDEKCDCFSFAILMFVLFSENFEPYGKGSAVANVELKVANDSSFRPNVNEIRKAFEENELELFERIKEMMIKCWDHDPKERYSFSKLVEIWEGLDEPKKDKERVEDGRERTELLNDEDDFDERDENVFELVGLLRKENRRLAQENSGMKEENNDLKMENVRLRGMIRE